MSDQQFDFLSDNNYKENPLSVGDTANSKIDIDQVEFISPGVVAARDRIASAKEYIGVNQRLKLTQQHQSQIMMSPNFKNLNNTSSKFDARTPSMNQMQNIYHDSALLQQVQRMETALATNMTVDEPVIRNSPSKMKAGYTIQVNKYVPHFQRIPTNFNKKDFKMFEFGPEALNNETVYNKIRDYILKFDRVMIDTLMLDRENKYKKMFKNFDINTQEVSDQSPQNSERESTVKKIKHVKKPADEEEFDSDEERENAGIMFINDLQ